MNERQKTFSSEELIQLRIKADLEEPSDVDTPKHIPLPQLSS